jgi:hypothetical protein
LFFLERQHRSARNPREIVDKGQRDGNDDSQKAGIADRDQIDRDDEIRKRPLQDDIAHDDHVGAARLGDWDAVGWSDQPEQLPVPYEHEDMDRISA